MWGKGLGTRIRVWGLGFEEWGLDFRDVGFGNPKTFTSPLWVLVLCFLGLKISGTLRGFQRGYVPVTQSDVGGIFLYRA